MIYIIHQTSFTIHSNPVEIHQQDRTEILSCFCLSMWTLVLRLLILLVDIWGCFILNVQWIIKRTGFKMQFVHLSWYNPDTLQCCTSCGLALEQAQHLNWILDRKIKSSLFLICVKWIYVCKSDRRCERVNYLFTNVADDLTLLSEFNRLWASLNLILNHQTNLFATPLAIFNWFQMHGGVILHSAAWYISFLFFCHCEGKIVDKYMHHEYHF